MTLLLLADLEEGAPVDPLPVRVVAGQGEQNRDEQDRRRAAGERQRARRGEDRARDPAGVRAGDDEEALADAPAATVGPAG